MTDTASGLPSPFFRRLAAYGIDLLLIYVYVILLFGLSMAVNAVFPFHHLMGESYLLRHSIALFTLSIPVLIWFWKWESGPHQATPGKRVMKIRLENTGADALDSKQVLVRNVLKFLPWEWAHTFLHLYPDFLMGGDAPTAAIWLGMVAPQIVVLGYAAAVIFRKDRRSPYDLISGIQVVGLARSVSPRLSTSAAAFLFIALGVQSTAAQHRPDEAVARITFDSHVLEAGSVDLQHAIGLEGHVIIDHLVLGGSGQVHLSASNSTGRLQAGGASLHVGLLVFARKEWTLYPTTGFGIRGAQWTPVTGSSNSRLDLTGRIALNLDRTIPGGRSSGAARIGLRVGWQPIIRTGSWEMPGESMHIAHSPWFVGMNVGFGVGSAAR